MVTLYSKCCSIAEEARINNKVVLVHCMAGISRSVTITIAYLMKFHRMSMNRAYQYLKDMRPAISPNLNFMGQLVEFERSLELGNDQHSPQITTSDPLVATTTSSPDVMTPSKVRPLIQGREGVKCDCGRICFVNQHKMCLLAARALLLVASLADPNPGS